MTTILFADFLGKAGVTDSIVKILGVGLSGFGLLLMYLAYKLIKDAIVKGKVDPSVRQLILRFMTICSVMTVMVGISTAVSAFYKESVIAKKEKVIHQAEKDIGILTKSQKNDSIAVEFKEKIANGEVVDIEEFKHQQEVLLDTLAGLVQNGSTNPEVTSKKVQRFAELKDSILMLPTIIDSTAEAKVKDSLVTEYARLNKEVHAISTQAVESSAMMRAE